MTREEAIPADAEDFQLPAVVAGAVVAVVSPEPSSPVPSSSPK